MFLLSVGTSLLNYVALHPRRPCSHYYYYYRYYGKLRYHCNNVWRKVQILICPIVQFFCFLL